MKIIQRARFAAGPGGYRHPDEAPARSGYSSNHLLADPATVEIGGLKFYSDVPQTAAEAARINQELERVLTVTEAAV